MSEVLELSEMEFRLIRDFIHERFGIYFREEKRSFMRMKLASRVQSLRLNSFGEYLNHLKYSDPERQEVMRMVSFLTNNETYFFRELPQLFAFRDYLLPELKKKKQAEGNKAIRILSAGCSTGEEAYTLAMLVFETGGFFWGWDVQVIGMDINWRALDQAQRGVYFKHSFRMVDPEYIRRFFSENSGDFIIKDQIRRMARFQHGNITDPSTLEDLQDLDVIFCRNVLIYFSEEKIQAAIGNFHRMLRPGGHLLLGHSENIPGYFADFESRRFPETISYRKRGGTE